MLCHLFSLLFGTLNYTMSDPRILLLLRTLKKGLVTYHFETLRKNDINDDNNINNNDDSWQQLHHRSWKLGKWNWILSKLKTDKLTFEQMTARTSNRYTLYLGIGIHLFDHMALLIINWVIFCKTGSYWNEMLMNISKFVDVQIVIEKPSWETILKLFRWFWKKSNF